MADHSDDESNLTGTLLVAMPNMPDSRFARSVIFMCAHSAEGAMGIVINQVAEGLAFSDVIEQLDIEATQHWDHAIHTGGPVETSRGFVLHSTDYESDGTLEINEDFSLTATIDVLRDMATGTGPAHCVLALGYAGWSPGQLDREIQQNGWLTVPADASLVFDNDVEAKWIRALAKIGVDPSLLSGVAGHA
jgi:putative transcriptional regulator